MTYFLIYLSVFIVSTIASTNNFAIDLYQKSLIGHENGNLIISPFSVYTAIGLMFMGANEITAQEIVESLQLNSTDKISIAKQFGHLLKTQKNPSLAIANKVYVKNNYAISEKFNIIATNYFYSESENIDFEKSEQSASIINDWVENKTNHKIENLISAEHLNDETRIVLVNAIYFKGDWLYKFDISLTRKEKFWISEDKFVEVDMMNSMIPCFHGYVAELQADVIVLPYDNSDFQMKIILPRKLDGLEYLERNLHKVNKLRLDDLVDYGNISVHIPRFKIEFSIKLNDVLAQMGMETMFSDDADFSGLLENKEKVKISKVVHKAFIEVNEEGVEAAAATGVFADKILGGNPTFRADHPFLFAITDTENVLFSGRVKSF